MDKIKNIVYLLGIQKSLTAIKSDSKKEKS
jgi:hypothetical protein